MHRVPKIIKARARYLGYTLRDLAKAIDVSDTKFNFLFTGQQIINRHQLATVAEILLMDPAELYEAIPKNVDAQFYEDLVPQVRSEPQKAAV
jgi:hypothetical protein